MGESEELLDIHQAAAFLQVSVTSLRRWTDAGRLACLRVGRRRERRFRRSDLVAFLEDEPAARASGHAAAQHAREGVTSIGGIDVAHGTHLFGCYASDLARATIAAGFLADGVRPKSACFLAAEPDAAKMVIAHLERRVPALRARIDAGDLVITRLADSASEQLAFWESALLAATRGGATSVRLVGDVWKLEQSIGPRGLIEYEESLDRLIARRFPLVTLCLYDVRRFGSAAMLAALKGHPDTFGYPAERILG
ncbi:MAG TPA: MEDS domain-containing protein [Planctomycetota bacterium]|nr:MEDS domain-containing protein [Planctomycetota bacterium]